MNLHENAIRVWLEKYNNLEREHDSYCDADLKYRASGDDYSESRVAEMMSQLYAQMSGMRQALEIFGYTVIAQDGINKVVPQ